MRDNEVFNIFQLYKNIVIVGISPDPERPSHRIAQYLLDHDFKILGVRPGATTVCGQPCYNRLSDIPGNIEIVDVFRNSDAVPEIVEECLVLKPKVLWLQEGVSHSEAEEKARQSGIIVVSDRCILKEHQKFLKNQR